MKFILNEFPDDENFQPNEDWTPLKESSNLWIIQFQAIPFMIVNVAMAILLLRFIGIRFDYNTTTMLISFLIFMPFHELSHALFFPESLLSNNVFFGFTFKGLAPFVAYIGEMNRSTFIKVSLAPLVLISVLCLTYLIAFGGNPLIEHILVFNALGACADCLGVFLILRQVPRHSIVRNKKIRTFWRLKNAQ